MVIAFPELWQPSYPCAQGSCEMSCPGHSRIPAFPTVPNCSSHSSWASKYEAQTDYPWIADIQNCEHNTFFLMLRQQLVTGTQPSLCFLWISICYFFSTTPQHWWCNPQGKNHNAYNKYHCSFYSQRERWERWMLKMRLTPLFLCFKSLTPLSMRSSPLCP